MLLSLFSSPFLPNSLCQTPFAARWISCATKDRDRSILLPPKLYLLGSDLRPSHQEKSMFQGPRRMELLSGVVLVLVATIITLTFLRSRAVSARFLGGHSRALFAMRTPNSHNHSYVHYSLYLNSRANGSLITPITFAYSHQSRQYGPLRFWYGRILRLRSLVQWSKRDRPSLKPCKSIERAWCLMVRTPWHKYLKLHTWKIVPISAETALPKLWHSVGLGQSKPKYKQKNKDQKAEICQPFPARPHKARALKLPLTNPNSRIFQDSSGAWGVRRKEGREAYAGVDRGWALLD